MDETNPAIDCIARAICAEKCAFMGEPPCWQIGDGLSPDCDEPGCHALACAAFAALPEIRALIENDLAGLRLQRDSWRAKALATPQGQETLRWAEGEAERLRGVMADPQQKGRPWEDFRAEIVAMIEKGEKR